MAQQNSWNQIQASRNRKLWQEALKQAIKNEQIAVELFGSDSWQARNQAFVVAKVIQKA